jgi:hypothetical protein
MCNIVAHHIYCGLFSCTKWSTQGCCQDTHNSSKKEASNPWCYTFLPSFSSCFIVPRTINQPFICLLLQYAFNIFKCIFSHCVVWNQFLFEMFLLSTLCHLCMQKECVEVPSKLKASLTLIQLVNMKQLFLQRDNVMLILNYMVFIFYKFHDLQRWIC